MSFQYDAEHLLPGHGDTFESQERQLWFGREMQQVIVPGAVMDKDTVDSGNSTTTVLRPGLALGKIDTGTDNQVTHWNPYATDGSHRLFGFLMQSQVTTLHGTAKERFIGRIMVAGNIKAASILIGGESTHGISGTNYEFLLREQMADRFLVDDDLGTITGRKQKELAASATLTTEDHNTFFTNVGAAGAVTATLPVPVPGLRFAFKTVAAQDFVLEGPGTGEYFVAKANANSVTLTEATEEWVEVIGVRTAATPTFQYLVSAAVET